MTAPAPAPAAASAQPAPVSTDYRHDGIYARASIGLSYVSFFGEGPSGAASISGSGPALSLSVGGTPWEGVAVAGTFGFAAASATTFHGAPTTAEGNAHGVAPLIGALFDWYPNPTGGWHLAGGLGLGGYSLSDAASHKYLGYAPAVEGVGGYDAWIASQFALGVELFASLAGSTASHDRLRRSTGYQFETAAVGVETTVLWH